MSATHEPDVFERRHRIKRGEPTWDIAFLYPCQGDWTEEEYLNLDTNLLIEYVDGCLEFLPMPTIFHQCIVLFLYDSLRVWVIAQALDGTVLTAPLRVKLLRRRIRQPDVVYLRPEQIVDLHLPPLGAALAMEVVSKGKRSRKRDLVTKRREYAKAKIQEYWIVDPQEQKITVLVLDGKDYRVHGEFGPGQQATSVLLPGFTVDVSAVFAAGEGRTKP